MLWAGLALMVPLPLVSGVVTGLVPVARILMLAGICLLVMLLENANGAVGLLLGMLLGQAVLYLLGLYAVAHLLARALSWLPPRAVGWSVGLLLLVGVLLAASTDAYRTPFRAAAIRSSLLEVFE